LGGYFVNMRWHPIHTPPLQSLVKYCKRDDPQIRNWSAEYQEVWGFSVQDLISKDWRHQYAQLRQPQLRIPEARHTATSPIAIPRPQHRDSDPLFRSSSASPSAYPSLGRSLGELRLHSRPLHLDSRLPGDMNDTEPKRMISDADIDPVLQGGSNQRNHGLIDGPQSLPSLKASGLLDSWNSAKDSSAAGTWTTGSHSRADNQLNRHSPPRRSSPSPLPVSSSVPYDSDCSRTATNGMPVGMSWLANESR
jgi:hypothetical protein